MMRVNTGVNEFNIPARAESILVSAFINKKAGIKLPRKPAINRYLKSFFCMFLRYRIEYGNKTNQARNIRMHAA
jgi:hypothetical protein